MTSSASNAFLPPCAQLLKRFKLNTSTSPGVELQDGYLGFNASLGVFYNPTKTKNQVLVFVHLRLKHNKQTMHIHFISFLIVLLFQSQALFLSLPLISLGHISAIKPPATQIPP